MHELTSPPKSPVPPIAGEGPPVAGEAPPAAPVTETCGKHLTSVRLLTTVQKSSWDVLCCV